MGPTGRGPMNQGQVAFPATFIFHCRSAETMRHSYLKAIIGSTLIARRAGM